MTGMPRARDSLRELGADLRPFFVGVRALRERGCGRMLAGDWGYDGQDVKFMDALLHTEGLIAGFSGHDHQNSRARDSLRELGADLRPFFVGVRALRERGCGRMLDGQDVKFMDALLHTEGLIAGFSGHDHQNDWYARLRCEGAHP
jgi:hypothetical protein